MTLKRWHELTDDSFSDGMKIGLRKMYTYFAINDEVEAFNKSKQQREQDEQERLNNHNGISR